VYIQVIADLKNHEIMNKKTLIMAEGSFVSGLYKLLAI
jgi:hypothetical protein